MTTKYASREAYISYLLNEGAGQLELDTFVRREVYYCVSSLIGDLAKSSDPNIANELEEARILETDPDYLVAIEENGWRLFKFQGEFYAMESSDMDKIEVATSHSVHNEPFTLFFWSFDGEADPENRPYISEQEAKLACIREHGWPLNGDTELEAARELCDDKSLDVDDYRREVFEHWIVSDWLAGKLSELGEATGEVFGLTVWGRTTTGQSIGSDYVIAEVYADVHSEKWSDNTDTTEG